MIQRQIYLYHSRSPGIQSEMLGSKFLGDRFPIDVDYLAELSIWPDILADDWLTYGVRGNVGI